MDTVLKPKQMVFVQHYLATGNSTEAYVKAYGCTKQAARASGARLLTVAAVRMAIDEAVNSSAMGATVNAAWVIDRMRLEALYSGRDSSHAARVKALELLGRMFNLFPSRYEHSGPGGGPIKLNLTKLDDAEIDKIDELLSKAIESPETPPPDAGGGSSGEGPPALPGIREVGLAGPEPGSPAAMGVVPECDMRPPPGSP